MKKYRLATILVFALILMVSCANTGDSDRDEGDKAERLLYSNLLDQESRTLVREAMESADIAAENVDLFFRQVDLFNSAVENYGLVEEGFKYPISVEPEYDPYEMQDIFYGNSPDFMGYNCRITSYVLMRDLIDVKYPIVGDTNIIIFDEESVENGPEKIFNDEEFREFRSLYSAVPTEDTQDPEVHVANVKKSWEEKQISFAGDAKLISVYFHENEDGDSFLFIGHVGVMVPAADGGFYFIEKVAFQEPYQVILFPDRSSLKDYLLAKYDLSWGQDTADPFVMENGELMN